MGLILLGLPPKDAFAHKEDNLKLEISFPAEAHGDPITGRVYAIISRNDEEEPRFQTGYTGVPIWGQNVTGLRPGETSVINDDAYGYPLELTKDIPAGEYFVQGFINIYTEFTRSDGHRIWLHDDQWEGQRWNHSPGNLYSDAIKVTIDPASNQTIQLNCKNAIPAGRDTPRHAISEAHEISKQNPD